MPFFNQLSHLTTHNELPSKKMSGHKKRVLIRAKGEDDVEDGSLAPIKAVNDSLDCTKVGGRE